MAVNASHNGMHPGRGRTLAILGGATLVAAVLAVLAVVQRSGDQAPAYQAHPIYPEFSQYLDNLGEITVQTKDSTFHIRQIEGTGWVVAERNDFPADPAMVRAMGIGLSGLEAVEPKTARPDLHAALGLVGPDKGGDAIRLTVADRAKAPLADLLVSRTLQPPDAEGRNRLFVRKADEDQTWLARGSLKAEPDVAAWLAKRIVTLPRERVQSVAIAPAMGPAYTLSRANAEQMDFTLANMPAGRELAFPGAATNAATMISEFNFNDIRPTAQVDFAKPAMVTVKTFDGLTLVVRLAMTDGAYWAAVRAEGTGERQQEAAALNAKTDGWAFKVADYFADALAPTRDSLLRTPTPATPAAAPAPATAP